MALVNFSQKAKELIAKKLPGNLMARKRELGTAALSLLLHLVILLLFSIWLLPGGAADEVLRLFSAARKNRHRKTWKSWSKSSSQTRCRI
ncbi:MAG UNVERIFIED_CONTAM: hypothetical protein LVR18_44965 [Planctomycetaceae bacterium]